MMPSEIHALKLAQSIGLELVEDELRQAGLLDQPRAERLQHGLALLEEADEGVARAGVEGSRWSQELARAQAAGRGLLDCRMASPGARRTDRSFHREHVPFLPTAQDRDTCVPARRVADPVRRAERPDRAARVERARDLLVQTLADPLRARMLACLLLVALVDQSGRARGGDGGAGRPW